MGRQALQLVVIPAAIVVICISLAFLFGKLAGAKANVQTYLLKLKQSSGAGRLEFGLQDPRYKDRGLAAYNIATLIPEMKDPAERAAVSAELVSILRHNVTTEEGVLRSYLLLALGQLGQPDALPVVTASLKETDEQVRQAAIGGLLSWPDRETVRPALPQLLLLLADVSPGVSASAAAAIGAIAPAGDADAVRALRDAMATPGLERRETVWNAAVALARLGDANGSRFVAEVLLNRAALATQPWRSGQQGAGAGREGNLPRVAQDRVMLSVLAASPGMTDPQVWDKITRLAESDPSSAVRDAAVRVLLQHREGR